MIKEIKIKNMHLFNSILVQSQLNWKLIYCLKFQFNEYFN